MAVFCVLIRGRLLHERRMVFIFLLDAGRIIKRRGGGCASGARVNMYGSLA